MPYLVKNLQSSLTFYRYPELLTFYRSPKLLNFIKIS